MLPEVCAGWAIGVPMVGMPILGEVGVGHVRQSCWRPKKNKALPHVMFFSTAYWVVTVVNQVTDLEPR